MKVHSLKLTIQDVPRQDKPEETFAGVYATLFLEDGNFKKDDEGNNLLDVEGQPIPLYDTINVVFPLNLYKGFEREVKDIITRMVTTDGINNDKTQKDGRETTRVRRNKPANEKVGGAKKGTTGGNRKRAGAK